MTRIDADSISKVRVFICVICVICGQTERLGGSSIEYPVSSFWRVSSLGCDGTAEGAGFIQEIACGTCNPM